MRKPFLPRRLVHEGSAEVLRQCAKKVGVNLQMLELEKEQVFLRSLRFQGEVQVVYAGQLEQRLLHH